MGKQRGTNRQIDRINARLKDADRDGLREDIKGSFLDDGGHTIIECSACGKRLCDIWVQRPTIRISSDIIANCGHCGDKAFQVTIDGQFSVGVTEDSLVADMRTDEFNTKDDGSMYQKVTIDTAPKR
jgi:hypothetical protein